MDGSKQSNKSRIPGLYRPPTHTELQTLKETQDLFKSNLMKLQITELLGEVKPAKTASTCQLETLLHTLKEMLLALPTSPQVDLSEGLSLLRGKVKYPLPFLPDNCKGKFKFGPPAAVRVVGSYLLGTWTKPDLHVDVELSLPMECLQVKDLLNYRYFHKRALYLSILASHLKKKKKSLCLKKIMFECRGGNLLVPVLSLVPEGKHLSKFHIRLHTSVLEPAYFKPGKLAPDRNNVRRNFLSDDGPSPDQSDKCDVGPPTPHYNAALLAELGARERHLKELFLCAQECPGLVDAAVLCRVWAKQRHFNKGCGAITGFHLTMLMCALFAHKRINRLMSCYQIFRVTLQHLVSTDWTEKGFHFPCLSSEPSLDAFHSAFDVVFLDSSGMLNLCADVGKERYRWLQHEAALGLQLLDDPTSRGFESLFMKQLPLDHKFDVLCHISLSSLSPRDSILDRATREGILLDGFAWPLPLVVSRILPILCRGLAKRVKLITMAATQENCEWVVTEDPPDPNTGHMILGLLLDTDHAFSILTMGPSADSAEAVEFRSFWGERSELRRFDDGSINEAVVWGGRGEGRSAVCHQIICHLLQRHFSVSADSVLPGASFSSLLRTTAKSKKSSEEVVQQIGDVFTELCQDLRRLKELPLTITSLQATSPTFRHTEVFSSLPWNGRKLGTITSEDSQSDCYYPSCDSATPPLVPVHPVVCQLESSGKWPEEVEAIKKIKVAFYVHLARALRKQKGLMASPTEGFLDILKSGYVFRLLIHHHRELVLLREGLAGSDAKQQRKQEVATAHRDLVALPVLTSTLNGLHQQFLAFGGGARLCKRWVSSHLLSNHIADEAVELMVAYLFTSPAPYTTPSTDLVVFARFLSLLSTHSWEEEPLVVNFNNELSVTQISDLCSEFSKTRSTLPPLVIVTPHDHPRFSSPWTSASSSAPSPPVFHRLLLLAKEAGSMLTNLTMGDSEIDSNTAKQLFRTPLQDFNILIHLDRKHVPLSHQAVDAMATGPSPHMSYQCTHLPVVDFDPVQLYLKELEVAFSDFALFFYDKYGGAFIAVLWKPHMLLPQSFKVGKAHCKVPGAKKSRNLVVSDVDAIIADFQLMGEGLVKNVEMLTVPDLTEKL